MIHLVTFATDDMSIAASRCTLTAVDHGVNVAYLQHPQSEDDPAVKGCGFWKWKPRIIQTVIENRAEWSTGTGFTREPPKIKDGDTLIYADAGIEFINNVSHIIDRMDQDIFLFGNLWEHAHWCKRDIVEYVWPLPIDRQSFVDAGVQMSTPSNLVAFDVEGIESLYSWARFGKQTQASVIFFRVSDYTRKFVKEWLDWCLFEGGRLIDDSPSRTPNHEQFRENRHDQSILTTMAYREGIKLHWWPAQYNDGAFVYERGDYPDEGYPVLFHHHRRRNYEWSAAA